MTRTDIRFSDAAETYILNRAMRLNNIYALVEEVIVLFNVLAVEKKDQFGKTTKEEGPSVYVGLERLAEGLDRVILPNSAKYVYLSGFEVEKDISLELEKGQHDQRPRLQICRT